MEVLLRVYNRLPPFQNYLKDLIEMKEESADELLSEVDQPLQVLEAKLPFLMSDYNRSGDYFRGPDQRLYDMEGNDQGEVEMTDKLKKLEVLLHEGFVTYTQLYYGSALSSCYCYEVEETTHCAILIKNKLDQAMWDSIHVVTFVEQEKIEYQVTSTIHCFMGQSGVMMGGHLRHQVAYIHVDSGDT